MTRKYPKLEITLKWDGRNKLIRDSKTEGVQEMINLIAKIPDDLFTGFSIAILSPAGKKGRVKLDKQLEIMRGKKK